MSAHRLKSSKRFIKIRVFLDLFIQHLIKCVNCLLSIYFGFGLILLPGQSFFFRTRRTGLFRPGRLLRAKPNSIGGIEMKDEYDLAEMKSRPNPYARRLNSSA